MVSRRTIALALAAALAACSEPTPGRSDNGAANAAAGGAGNGAASAPAGASKGAAAGPANGSASAPAAGSGSLAGALNPGEWETTAEAKISGMPPQVAKMLAGHKMVTRHCLTPEKAARPNSDLLGGKKHEGCTGDQPSVTGGRLHAAMSCRNPRGGTSTMTMDGPYGGDSFDITMVLAGEERGQSVRWETHSVGRRVGATCAAGTGKR